jgi:hypothetical protein
VATVWLAPGVYHRSEELLIAGPAARVVAAATADVDVLSAILPWHHALEQGLQQDRRAPCLELGISLTQEAPLLLDVLAVNRVASDTTSTNLPDISSSSSVIGLPQLQPASVSRWGQNGLIAATRSVETPRWYPKPVANRFL